MLSAMWDVLVELSPWLLLGSALAGLLHVALPAGFVSRHLGRRGGVLKAVLLGVPLPLCSCGVIPAGLGLKRDGASDGAAVGFLISTPQTGVDSILVSASFLGWPFAIFKLLSAALTGIVGGLATDITSPQESDSEADFGPAPAGTRRGPMEALGHAIEILRTIWRWVAFGIVVSAAIATLLPSDFFTALAGGGKLLPILAVLAISLPLYVCATASVPIAAALVAGGMPAGAALVFLMAGPATNVATIGAIYRGLGRRALTIYLTTIIAGSVLSGLAFDSLVEPSAPAGGHEHVAGSWWGTTSALVLLAILSWFALEELRDLLLRLRQAGRRTDASAVTATIAVSVQGMSCGSCVARLERALREERGVNTVRVTLQPGRAVVQGLLDEAQVRGVVERLGFHVVDSSLESP